ncbi:MAG TPA: ribonuclease Y [Clostridiales bacterium]|jgi:ribonuclease Y|nr:ribonuclease Y [Clostridiales bacterium]
MKTPAWIAIIFAACVIVGVVMFILGGILRKKQAEKTIGSAEDEANRIVTDAVNNAERTKKEAITDAKEEALRIRSEADSYVEMRRKDLDREQGRLERMESNLNQRTNQISKKEDQVRSKEDEINSKLNEAESFVRSQREMLTRISGYSEEQAKLTILQSVDESLDHEKAIRIRDMEEKTREEANEKANSIIAMAIQRLASDSVGQIAVSTVTLPNDEIKGRIIGREGRNVRTFEQITHTELIIDDTPESITISCFEPTTREIARLTLEKLIADGRIHPGSIETFYNKSVAEVEQTIKQTGERVVQDLGVNGIHPELVKLLGRLRYRTSFGQNVLDHSVEVARLAGYLAAELNCDVKTAKRAGLLHDIGKAMDRDNEGTHIELGVEQAKKYREKDVVVHAIWAHHGDVEAKSIYDFIIQAADAISAARPGARREDLANYIKRLEKLEDIAHSVSGVKEAYAIQAGRELRILVNPETVDDDKMQIMAHDIAQKVGNEVQMPGQIKVQIIRESRASALVK